MNKQRKFNYRYIPLYVLYAAACLFFTVKLVNLQITGADYYKSTSVITHEREAVVQSIRGEIYDRNGVPLVTNVYTESLELDYNSFPRSNQDKNEALVRIIKVLRDNGYEIETLMPVTGTYPHVEYDEEDLKAQASKNRMYRFLLYHNCRSDISCIDLYEELFNDYGLLDKSGKHIYDPDTEDEIIRIRYSLDSTNFAPGNPYPLVAETDLKLQTAVLENGCRGVFIKKNYKRYYNVLGVGSNIIGRVGKIPEDKVDEYTAKGYSYDAIVGLDGVEAAFEDILRGKDGVTVYIEDDYGTVIDSYVKVEPVPGKNVYLTIDIELQKVAEEALEKQIQKIVKDAKATGEENTGEKADSGALTVFSAKTGQILALASYPTYDLSTFSENYASLAADPKKPLFDRSLSGGYQPGSTFKIATSVAALMSKTITVNTVIDDKGKYTFYDDYQPSCWLKSGHGPVDLTSAIGVSCNYYFYETGRRTGIETMNQYSRLLGLGEYTGVELPETKGVLAGPEYKQKSGKTWYPGDTLQAAIGQSDNLFSPLQLSSYISTVVNGGTRYKATVLYKTENYSGSDTVYNEPVVIDDLELPDNVVSAMKQGMKKSKEMTSETRPYKFSVGTKTGTAQTDKTNNNALLVAFAPYDDPEITVSCVIENGAKGGNAAAPVFAAISQYFGLTENGEPLPEETE